MFLNLSNLNQLMNISSKLEKIKQIDNLPQHIAIIMDGNRRFAKAKGLASYLGHELAIKNMMNILFPRLFKDLEIPIKEFSFFTLSYDNYYKRSEEEVTKLMNYIKTFLLDASTSKLIKENGIKMNIVGDIHLLPEEIQNVLRQVEENTKTHEKYIFNFLIMYDGQKEVINATKEIAEAVKAGKISSDEIDENLFKEYCVTRDIPAPDLIIRTSNEIRLSGFFLFDSYYSEFIFLEKNWPEFQPEDLLDCILEYNERDRRKGK